jgi:hypothetical protein
MPSPLAREDPPPHEMEVEDHAHPEVASPWWFGYTR